MESAGMMRWLLTYADMITLLLALFIILFAISNISRVKFQRLATAISGGFSGTDALNQPPGHGRAGQQSALDRAQLEDEAQLQNIADLATRANLARVKARIDRYIAQQHLESKVQTRIEKRGLIITLLSDGTYYDSGSAQLRPETKRLLDQIGLQLATLRNDVRVEGNTDDVPIATAAYPTNWELSAARATGVTRYLVEHDRIVPTRISFAGYGEYRPRVANDTNAHRQQNRRVDIVILTGKSTPDAPDEETTMQQGAHPAAAANAPRSVAAAGTRAGGPSAAATAPRSVAAAGTRAGGPSAAATVPRSVQSEGTRGGGPSAAATVPRSVQSEGTRGGGPSAATPSAPHDVAARSARGPHATRGGRAAQGGAPFK